MIRVTQGGGPAERPRYLLDLVDAFDNSQVGTGQLFYVRRGGVLGAAGNVGPIWDLVNGMATEIGRANGLLWAGATSAAATLKRREATRWPIPVNADQSGHVSSGAGYYPLRYRIEVITWRVTNPLVALAPLYFGVQWSGGPIRALGDPGLNAAGYELFSQSNVNGGNWTVRTRLANGVSAPVELANTGISPQGAGPQHLEIRYDHTSAPRLSCFVNGQEFGVLQGLANLPGQGVANITQVTGVGQGLSVGGGVGQLDRMRQTRFRIEELAGFPD